jgi:hypothetical protein
MDEYQFLLHYYLINLQVVMAGIPAEGGQACLPASGGEYLRFGQHPDIRLGVSSGHVLKV